MKVSQYMPGYFALALALLSASHIAADNDIGYCQNLNDNSLEVTVDWRGIANSILSLVPVGGTASTILGGLLTLLPNIGVEEGIDYSEYKEQLGKCVNAMINEAIEDNELNNMGSALGHMADEVDKLVGNNGVFGKLNPNVDDKVLRDLETAVNNAHLYTDDIFTLFEGPSGYRHEKFTDGLLDALSEEASIYASSVAALKCNSCDQGCKLDQALVDSYAAGYINEIETRIRLYFDAGRTDSIPSQLINSDYYDWPDTMRIEKIEECTEWASNVCDDDGCCYPDCYDENECILYDGYRHDQRVDSVQFGCLDVGYCKVACEPIDNLQCDEMKARGEKHAQDTINNMMNDIDDVEQMLRDLTEAIADAAANPPTDEMCSPIKKMRQS